ncbi:MAG: hypothetical protein ABIS67_00655, partial [Candidatus Eisenbacteria bacterium]
MTERDPRAELAEITHSLRNVILRERPDGELLLQSAKVALRGGKVPAAAANAKRSASEPLDLTLPSHHDPLHPIEPLARAEILAASLPVLEAVGTEA